MTSGSWRLVVCGITHTTSTLEQREPLQLAREEMASANAAFGNLSRVMESLIVSTCNRVEFYFVTARENDPFEVVAEFYKNFKGINLTACRDLFRSRKGAHAASQLFHVAAGMDSMVLGENQILGQLKEAYGSACAVKSTGKLVHRLFHQAFRIGKQVRSDTEMGKGICSVSSAAMDLLKTRIQDIVDPEILFIGSNRMITLAADNLSRRDDAKFTFANRTPEKAVVLAEKYRSEGHGLDSLTDLIAKADVVVSCTSATEPVITHRMVEDAMAARGDRRLTVVDLAIPRDVDFGKVDHELVNVNDLDDIKAFVADQQAKRELALPQAEQIIESKLSEFTYWMQHVMQEPIYNGQSNTIEAIRAEELASILDRLTPELQSELNQVTRKMVNRVIQVTSRSVADHSE